MENENRKNIKLNNRDGAILIEINKIERKGEDIAGQGKILKTMSLSAYPKPEEA